MDETRIKELTEEVLAQLRGGTPAPPSSLEARVGALEAAVREMQSSRGTVVAAAIAVAQAPGQAHAHPSLQALGIAPGAHRCVVEPDKPCVQSGQCRALGH